MVKTKPETLENEIEAPVKNPSTLSAPLIILMVLIAIALFLTIYTTYQVRQYHKARTTEEQAFNAKLSTLKAEQKNLRDSLDLATLNLQKTQDKVRSALIDNRESQEDWILLKVKNYLELAQINAHWSDNPKIATAILQEGDNLLQKINRQKIFEIRQSIAKEIKELEAVQQNDVSGLLSQLDALQTLVDKLPLANTQFNEAKTPPKAESRQSFSWRDNLSESLLFLKKLVVINHYDIDTKPILSPLHLTLLRESIRMNLEEAQWAVLQKNETLYKQSLKKALLNTKRGLELQSKDTTFFIQQLQKLEKWQFSFTKPSIDGSLNLLNQLIDAKENLPKDNINKGDETR